MFKKNTKHQQPALISAASELPEKQRERLESSWAGTFYQEFFSRMNEETFSVLYSDLPSRPNVPINVLVGLEALKAGFGWSDAELYHHYCYDLQVRYALGYDRLGMKEFGFCLSCNRDAALINGFNLRMKLLRTQTIMQGAEICDFRIVVE